VIPVSVLEPGAACIAVGSLHGTEDDTMVLVGGPTSLMGFHVTPAGYTLIQVKALPGGAKDLALGIVGGRPGCAAVSQDGTHMTFFTVSDGLQETGSYVAPPHFTIEFDALLWCLVHCWHINPDPACFNGEYHCFAFMPKLNDGTVLAVDPNTGMATTVGTVPAG